MSHTSDTSSLSASPPAKKRVVKKKKVPTEFVSRGNFLAALSTLKKDLETASVNAVDPLRQKLRSGLNVFKRSCSLDPSTYSISSWSNLHYTSKKRFLTYALTNSIYRHDWSTAAMCLQLMLDIDMCSLFVYRTLILVLTNHPLTSSETLANFFSQVINLRDKSDQLMFLRQAFLLPDDMDEYISQERPMSMGIEDAETTSDDEE